MVPPRLHFLLQLLHLLGGVPLPGLELGRRCVPHRKECTAASRLAVGCGGCLVGSVVCCHCGVTFGVEARVKKVSVLPKSGGIQGGDADRVHLQNTAARNEVRRTSIGTKSRAEMKQLCVAATTEEEGKTKRKRTVKSK